MFNVFTGIVNPTNWGLGTAIVNYFRGNTEEAVKEAVNEAVEKAVTDEALEAARRAAEEAVKRAAEEAALETAKRVAEETAKRVAGEVSTINQYVWDTFAEAAEEAAKKAAEEAALEATKKAAEEAAFEAAFEAAKQEALEAAKQKALDVAKGAAEGICETDEFFNKTLTVVTEELQKSMDIGTTIGGICKAGGVAFASKLCYNYFTRKSAIGSFQPLSVEEVKPDAAFIAENKGEFTDQAALAEYSKSKTLVDFYNKVKAKDAEISVLVLIKQFNLNTVKAFSMLDTAFLDDLLNERVDNQCQIILTLAKQHGQELDPDQGRAKIGVEKAEENIQNQNNQPERKSAKDPGAVDNTVGKNDAKKSVISSLDPEIKVNSNAKNLFQQLDKQQQQEEEAAKKAAEEAKKQGNPNNRNLRRVVVKQ